MSLERLEQWDYVLKSIQLDVEFSKIPVVDSIVDFKVAIDTGRRRLLIGILNVSKGNVVSLVGADGEEGSQARQLDATSVGLY